MLKFDLFPHQLQAYFLRYHLYIQRALAEYYYWKGKQGGKKCGGDDDESDDDNSNSTTTASSILHSISLSKLTPQDDQNDEKHPKKQKEQKHGQKQQLLYDHFTRYYHAIVNHRQLQSLGYLGENIPIAGLSQYVVVDDNNNCNNTTTTTKTIPRPHDIINPAPTTPSPKSQFQTQLDLIKASHQRGDIKDDDYQNLLLDLSSFDQMVTMLNDYGLDINDPMVLEVLEMILHEEEEHKGAEQQSQQQDQPQPTTSTTSTTTTTTPSQPPQHGIKRSAVVAELDNQHVVAKGDGMVMKMGDDDAGSSKNTQNDRNNHQNDAQIQQPTHKPYIGGDDNNDETNPLVSLVPQQQQEQSQEPPKQ